LDVYWVDELVELSVVWLVAVKEHLQVGKLDSKKEILLGLLKGKRRVEMKAVLMVDVMVEHLVVKMVVLMVDLKVMSKE